jgi:hypothetical protein
MRRDKCKCGKYISWKDGYDAPNNTTCKFCNTIYKVESDDVTVYWLEEISPAKPLWRTEAR